MSISQDFRHAVRSLGKTPGLVTAVVLILAVGIGGSTAVFGAVHAVLLRSLAFPQADRLVRVFSARAPKGSLSPASGDGGTVLYTVSPPDFTDWRRENRVFSELAATNEGSYALTGDGPAEQVPGAEASGGFFTVMGVKPQSGRTFTPDDDQVDAPEVAVLGYGLWQRRFGADPGVIGQTARFDGVAYTIVGVMPPGFTYPGGSEVWLPIRFTAHDLTTQRGAHYLDVIGRLRPGVELQQARADIRGIAAQLREAYPKTNAESSADVRTLRETLVGNARPPLLMLLAAVGLVLLIACTNVASLLMVRGLSRQREFAIRSALGAGRGRLVRALLSESLLLALAGGAAGTLVAVWGVSLMAHLGTAGIPLLDRATVNGPVLAFALVLSMATGVLFGLLPAWQASGFDRLAERLKDEGRTASGGRGKRRTRNALVIVELALALVLLAGAGLLMKSFIQLEQVDLGFDRKGILTFGVSLPEAKYTEPTQSAEFYRALDERLEALPGVERAAAVFGPPLSGFRYSISAHDVDGRLLGDAEQDRLSVQVRIVTPGYFRTLGVPLRSGRDIGATDRAGTPPVLVVNEAAARMLWPGEDPLGHRFTIGTTFGLGRGRAGGQVVGVVGNMRERGPAAPIWPTIFLAHQQFPVGYMGVAMRTAGDPTALVQTARRALAELDPDVPPFQVRTMEQLVSASVAQPRLYTELLAIFAAVAVLLAAFGIYGLLAHTVVQRTREIGVRVALGASRKDVVRLVVRQAAGLSAVGIGAGLATVAILTRAIGGLNSFLFQVRPSDPVVLLLVGLGLLAVALGASYLPARRAAGVEPMEVLREG